MRFSTRSIASITLSLVALVTIMATLVVYLVTSRPAAHAAGGVVTFSGTTGIAKLYAVVNPKKLGSSSTAPSRAERSRSPRVPAGAGAAPDTISAPATAATPLTSSRVLRSFNGPNAVDEFRVRASHAEPPDEALAVNGRYVVSLVNEVGAIYRRDGTAVIGPFDINPFFAEPDNAFLSDPRAYFDKATNTWFAMIWEADFVNASESHIDLAVNPSGDPTQPWTIYRIDTTDPTGPGCPCLPDYTIFGIDQFNVYLSSNEFSIAGPNFNGAQVYAVSKSQLVALASNVNFALFPNLSIGGTVAYHVQPATSYQNPPAEYFMNSFSFNSRGNVIPYDNRLGVWAMTNRQAVSNGGVPNFSATVINSEAYAFTVNARTPVGFNPLFNQRTTGKLDADFDAMQEVEYIDGSLVASLDTAISTPGDTATRDGIAWFEVTPKLSGRVISPSTSVSDQGYLAVLGSYLLYPHIEQNAVGLTGVTFSITSPTIYPSAAFAVLPVGQHNFQAVQVVGPGANADNGDTCVRARLGLCRWGDYSAGQLDPTSNNIWFATQYIPGVGSPGANWGNFIFEIQG